MPVVLLGSCLRSTTRTRSRPATRHARCQDDWWWPRRLCCSGSRAASSPAGRGRGGRRAARRPGAPRHSQQWGERRGRPFTSPHSVLFLSSPSSSAAALRSRTTTHRGRSSRPANMDGVDIVFTGFQPRHGPSFSIRL